MLNIGSPYKYVCLNRRPCESPINPDKVETNGGLPPEGNATVANIHFIVINFFYQDFFGIKQDEWTWYISSLQN